MWLHSLYVHTHNSSHLLFYIVDYSWVVSNVLEKEGQFPGKIRKRRLLRRIRIVRVGEWKWESPRIERNTIITQDWPLMWMSRDWMYRSLSASPTTKSREARGSPQIYESFFICPSQEGILMLCASKPTFVNFKEMNKWNPSLLFHTLLTL